MGLLGYMGDLLLIDMGSRLSTNIRFPYQFVT